MITVSEFNTALREMNVLWDKAKYLKDAMQLAGTCDKWVSVELEFQNKISEFISASAKVNRLFRQYQEEHANA